MQPQAKLVPASQDADATSHRPAPNGNGLTPGAEISAEVPRQSSGNGLGLALSGGGFRATLFHLGVIAYLRQSNKLRGVTHITSVSGGSILAAHLVLNWEAYIGDQDSFEKAAQEIIDFVRKDIRGRVYRRAPLHLPFRFMPQPAAAIPTKRRPWRVRSLRKSTTDLLIEYYSDLYQNETLAHLERENRPQLYLLTTNQTDGTLCSFTSSGFRDEERKHEFECDISLARAVAASSAFPGLFPPVALTPRNSGIPRRELGHAEILLTDGGVYDNLGLRKFHRLMKNNSVEVEYVVVSDASAEFKVGFRGGLLEPLRTSLRAADILSKRINDLEREMARDDKFKLVDIGRIVGKSIDPSAMAPVLQRELVSIRTDLDEFSELEIAALVRHGYCVARARLELDQNSRAPNTTVEAWDPLPKSKNSDVAALRDSKRGQNEELRQKLDRSSTRKLRLLSARDRVSYLQVLAVVAIVLAYLFIPSLYTKFADLQTENSISSSVVSLRDSYLREILKRKMETGAVTGFASMPGKGSRSIETWNTSQAAYAVLKSKALSKPDRDFVIDALKSRFSEVELGDYRKDVDGWIGRPSLPHLQAEPAVWTGAALAVALQHEDLPDEQRKVLEELLRRVTNYLERAVFFPVQSEGRVGFNVLANQVESTKHSAYTTSLGLLMLTEMDRAGQQWNGQDPKHSMRRLLEWLKYEYVDDEPSGWVALAGDEANSPSEAASLQCFAIMLDAYTHLNDGVPNKIKLRIRDHLIRLGKQPPDESESTANLLVHEAPDTPKQAEARIRFLWRPWAIRLYRGWLNHLDQHPDGHEKPIDSDERIEFRNTLYRLVVEDGGQQFRSEEKKGTFLLSEMLIAYSD